MSIRQKAIQGTGIVQLRSTLSSSDGTLVTEMETWTGPYADLKTKQKAVYLGVKATNLQPSEANHGILTITRELDLSATNEATVPNQVTIEVTWQELRRPVETNPYFKDLTQWKIKEMRDLAASENTATLETDEVAQYLLELLLRGTTEWSTGVPVVRRTTTKRSGRENKGMAWFRDDPPVDVAGDWEFLKTANNTQRDGKSFSQIEEWTGAEVWDAKLYPAATP